MRRLAPLLFGVALVACSGPSVLPTPPVSSPAEAPSCGDIAAELCREVAEAAERMIPTTARSVEALSPPSDGGLQMAERYLVRLDADADGNELVEVVRFEGSENWSVRRVAAPPE